MVYFRGIISISGAALFIGLLSSGILVAQQTIGGLVLFDFREAAHGGIEPVVGVVIVALGNLAQQHGTGAFFHGKIVVHTLGHPQTLARGQTDLGAGRHGVSTAVTNMHCTTWVWESYCKE